MLFRSTFIGVFTLDGSGSWNATLTINDKGTITHSPNNPGTYIVNADCTGTLFPTSGGMGSIEIVVVDGGREFYQMRTAPSTIVLYGVTKQL